MADKKSGEEKKRDDVKKKWDDANTRAESGDFNFVELKDGINPIRIVDLNFKEVYQHFIEDVEGNTAKIICPAEDNRNEAAELCPVCREYKDTKNKEIRPQHRFIFNVLEGEGQRVESSKSGKKGIKYVFGNQVKMLDIGEMIFKQVYAIQIDDEYPDVDKFYLKINKTGKDKKTKYDVNPSPKETPLPEDLTELYDLEDLFAPTPLSEVKRLMGIENGGGDEDSDVGEIDDDNDKDEETVSEDELDDLDELDK